MNAMQNRFNEFCKRNLDLNERDMLYYSSLPLCALDAVLSIRLDYDQQVIPALQSFCNRFKMGMPTEKSTEVPAINDQITVNAFVERVQAEGLWGDNLSSVIGTYRTAGSKSILKSTAFVSFVTTLVNNHINTYQDINGLSDQDKLNLENVLKHIKGQKVSVDYFFMLAGEKNMVKVDTWLTRFSKLATKKSDLSNQQIINLFVNAAKALSTKKNQISPRRLDHIAWGWMRCQAMRSNTLNKKSSTPKHRKSPKSSINTKRGISELPTGVNMLKRSIEKGYIVNTDGEEFYLFVGKDNQKTYCEVLSRKGQYSNENTLIQKGFTKRGGSNSYYIKVFGKDSLNEAISFMERMKELFK